ncbi:hypothetical protein [Mucilaginibacter psychrotolerans]|uniref:GMC family oxidoreductase n=1 Tax=Mucilaginibacter psychrotolerans TaxID=1524096 RepID=A0A4Y8SB04_9SPHI|nr:hypothetical protein [Mucilaginibacter psychrotolerans]TFF36199.1 hypothetical protein E2R66_16800 [Mucilaginibacter psychrotolerans]
MKFLTQLNESENYDIVIVGAGLSGLECGNILSKKGIKILIIESGPIGPLAHLNSLQPTSRAFKTWLQGHLLDPFFKKVNNSLSPPHFQNHSGLRSLVGGRSLYWRGVILPMENYALHQWPVESSLFRDNYQVVYKELTNWDESTLKNKLLNLFDNAKLTGFQNTPRAKQSFEGLSGLVYSPLYSLLSSTEGECHILTNCNVKGISKDGKNWKLEYINNRESKALLVSKCVLASGTIENSRLVRSLARTRKSIRNKFNKFKIYDHIIQGVLVRINKSLINLDDFVSDNSVVKIGNQIVRSNTFCSLKKSQNYYLLDIWGLGEQLPDQTHLQFKSNGTLPYVEVKLNAFDDFVLIQQVEEIKNIHSELMIYFNFSQKEVIFPKFGTAGFTYSDVLKKIENSESKMSCEPYYCPLGTVDHEGGTIPFGDSLNYDGSFLDTESLYILGPSTFPRMGAANPSLTNITLSRFISENYISK